MQWPQVIAHANWGSGGAVIPHRVQGRALVGVHGAKPPEGLKILHFALR